MGTRPEHRRPIDWRFELTGWLIYWVLSFVFPGATYRRRAARLRRGPRAIVRHAFAFVVVRFVLLDVVSPLLKAQVAEVDARIEALTERLGRKPTYEEVRRDLLSRPGRNA